MRLFNRKKDQNSQKKDKERKEPITISLSNGQAILVLPVEDAIEKDDFVHSDGRQTKLRIVGLTNQYIPGDVMKLTPSRYIAFETGVNQEVDMNVMESVISEVLNQGLMEQSGCFYVGEYDSNEGILNKFSKSVNNYIMNKVAPKMNEILSKNNSTVISMNIVDAKNNNLRDRLSTQIDEKNKRKEKIIQERLENPYFKKMSSYKTPEGRIVDNYEGINLSNGDILKIKKLDKVGKDGSGTYLYAGFIQSVEDKGIYEVLNPDAEPLGAYICFTTEERLDDIIESGDVNKIMGVLSLLSLPREKFQKNGTLNYIGSLQENNEISRLENESRAITNTIQQLRSNYEKIKNQENCNGLTNIDY